MGTSKLKEQMTHEHPALHWQPLPHLQLGFPHPDIVQGWMGGIREGRMRCRRIRSRGGRSGKLREWRMRNPEDASVLYTHSWFAFYGQAGHLIGCAADGCDDRNSHHIYGGQTRTLSTLSWAPTTVTKGRNMAPP